MQKLNMESEQGNPFFHYVSYNRKARDVCPEKIVYIADYIEPARNKSTESYKVRKLAFEDLDECMYEILKDTLFILKKTQRTLMLQQKKHLNITAFCIRTGVQKNIPDAERNGI